MCLGRSLPNGRQAVVSPLGLSNLFDCAIPIRAYKSFSHVLGWRGVSRSLHSIRPGKTIESCVNRVKHIAPMKFCIRWWRLNVLDLKAAILESGRGSPPTGCFDASPRYSVHGNQSSNWVKVSRLGFWFVLLICSTHGVAALTKQG